MRINHEISVYVITLGEGRRVLFRFLNSSCIRFNHSTNNDDMFIITKMLVVLVVDLVFYRSLQYVYFALVLTVTVECFRLAVDIRQAAVTCSVQQGAVRTNVWIH